MNRFRIAVILPLFLFPIISFAQKTIIADGKYIYYAPSDVSIDQAKELALERAMNQIIADNFGMVVGTTNVTKTENDGSDSSVSFLSMGGSEVKGEWLETIGDPVFEVSYERDILVVRVYVKGCIREINNADVPFEAKILRNGVEDRNEDDRFFDNDDLFISFSSSESGYLAIYLYDNRSVYRLLPTTMQSEGSVFVKGGERMVFFDEETCNYYLTCEDKLEWNRIYVIFSTKKFSRAMDVSMPDSSKPAYLTFESFQRWLAKSRKQDLAMRVVTKDVTITKQ